MSIENFTLVDGKYADLPRTNMPLAVDDINEMQDITLDLVSARDLFYAYMDAGDLTNATTVINNNPNLLACLFNADKYNSLRDSMIALERVFLTDIQDYIINLSTPQGEWQNNKSYSKYQVVSYIYQDATQFYCARQMSVPANSTVSYNTNPTNTYYWTPITLRGMQGDPGTGLSPMGIWNNTTQYYNYTNSTTNMPIISLVYYNNIFWQATTNNINSEPTSTIENGEVVSNNSDWLVIMALNQVANTILMPYGDSISNVIDRFDNRSKLDLQSLIADGYTYYANKTSDNIWNETAKYSNGETYAQKITTKTSNGYLIDFYCPDSNMQFTITYTKDADGNWKGVRS